MSGSDLITRAATAARSNEANMRRIIGEFPFRLDMREGFALFEPGIDLRQRLLPAFHRDGRRNGPGFVSAHAARQRRR